LIGVGFVKGHLENEKTSWLVFFVCFFGYVLVSMTKNTYATAMSAIVSEGLFNKADVGLINASFYLVYGCTQMLGGYLVDKVSPFKIFAFGVLLSAACNAVMACSVSYTVMLVAWSINGLAQFGIWPAVIKIVASVVMPEHRAKTMTFLAFAYPLGTLISYLVAAGVLKIGHWSGLFWVSFATLISVAVFLIYSERKTKKELVPDEEKEENTENKEKSGESLVKLILKSGLVFMTIPALVRCMLDVGLKNWLPTMVMENYGTSPSFSTFITTLLLIVNLSAVFFANLLYPKRCKNAVSGIGIFFVISIPFLAIIILTGKIPVSVIILSLALVTTFMTSASQLMNVIVPAAFEKAGKTGAIAGFINSFGAFGCMASNYAYGYMAEHFGWTFTTITWVLIGVIATVFSFANAPFWKKYTAKI